MEKKIFQNISHLSADSKLGQFSFKLFHRILLTKKELKRFKISDSEDCFFCKSPDSLEHAFLYCPADFCPRDMESCHHAAARRVKLSSLNANLFFKEPQQLTLKVA